MSALAGLVDRGLMAPDWAAALAPVDDTSPASAPSCATRLAAGRGYQPSGDNVFRAFRRPLAEVRVLVVGQDPYPNPRHPIGLSFAVERDVWPLPPSLLNIYKELRSDLDVMPPFHGDLSGWADQGVMLLNRVLTVRPGDSNSHRGQGWEEVTECAIRALAARAEAGPPLVAVLWGTRARSSRCSARCPRSSPPTRRRSRPTAASSARGRSARSTHSSPSAARPVDWSLA